MIEVNVFTIVVAQPDAPSVVVLAEKSAVAHIFGGEKPTGNNLVLDALEDRDHLAPQLLPIWIGHTEAETIMLLLDNQARSRPLPHDLMANIVNTLESKVEHVVINKVVGSTFYATICLYKDGRPVYVDARPSDAIALALRTSASIYIDKDVMNAAAHQVNIKVSDAGELLYSIDDEVDKFHSFIEALKPEDFTR